MQPKISVIVPVYKAEKYLHRCVDSILAQTFTDFELILVNDGSPDNSGSICDEYTAKDNRIKVIHKENAGANSARKEGFIHSTGKYLVFMDSDDTLADGALKTLHNNIIKGYDVVKGSSVRTDQKGNIISQELFKFSEGIIEENKDIIINFFTEDISPYLWGGIYKKELFTTEIFNKSIDARITFGEDWLTNLLIADNIHKILCIKDVVYNYYVNRNSVTTSQVVSIEYFNRLNNVLKDFILDKKKYLEQLAKVRICTTYIRTFFHPEVSFDFNNYKVVIQLLKDKNIYNLSKQKIDNKFLRFIHYRFIYYIYTRIYCILFFILKLHCKSRKILR